MTVCNCSDIAGATDRFYKLRKLRRRLPAPLPVDRDEQRRTHAGTLRGEHVVGSPRLRRTNGGGGGSGGGGVAVAVAVAAAVAVAVLLM